jgi:hypothetical protein
MRREEDEVQVGCPVGEPYRGLARMNADPNSGESGDQHILFGQRF